jgi:predicted PurR-regulated permease PerM
MRTLEDRVFLGFVIAVSLAMAWVVLPFFGAILWGVVAAILFEPLNRFMVVRNPTRRNSAAAASLLAVIAIVIIPAVVIGTLLVEEAITTYNNLQTQQIDLGRIFRDVKAGLPDSVEESLDRMGFGNIQAIQDRASAVLSSGLRVAATQAVSVGQGAFNFFISLSIMLYLTFFLLRDGRELNRKIGHHIPLRPETRRDLFEKFATVIRATIKGSIVVAIVQGLIGGIVFWILGIQAALLWGVVMGFMSLIPAIGTGVVWVPVAIYLFATGQIWQGAVLVGCGIFVIGMVDNVLRPILVGKDTRMPDYVVLISTLGGLSVMGIHGFVTGPVIAALFIAAWDIFAAEQEERRNAEAGPA